MVRIAKWLILVIPFLMAPVAVEMLMRHRSGGAHRTVQHCLQWGNPYLHHIYLPNCKSYIHTKLGVTVEYSFNEDGLRDRPRAEFAGGSFQVYGDSVVKGLFAPAHHTLPAELERRLSPELGYPFLNTGLRGSSPITQSNRFDMVQEYYPLKGVLVFLNGTDPEDEIFFHSQAVRNDAEGVPTELTTGELTDWRYDIVTSLHRTFPTSILAMYLIEKLRMREWRELVQPIPRNEANICGGIYRFARHIDATKVPYAFIFLPHWKKGMDLYFNNRPGGYVEAEYQLMIDCAKKTKAKVIDLTPLVPELKEEYFFGDYLHYRYVGVQWLVDHIEDDVRQLFSRKKRR